MKPQMKKETLELKPVVLKKVVLAQKQSINTEKKCLKHSNVTSLITMHFYIQLYYFLILLCVFL